MSGRTEPDAAFLIDGHFSVDVARALPQAGGGIPAFAASSRRGGEPPLMALRVDRRAPARPRHLRGLTNGIDGLLTPLAYGNGPPVDGLPGWFVICQAPSGPPLSSGLKPWGEHQILDQVLRPVAGMLDQLHTMDLTHRAIRPNNVFNGQPNRPVTLGAAWAAPPAMHQPTVFETAYTALCHPNGRGDGTIADDVYALGVLLVVLALGRVPMATLDERTIMHRKLELGDFAAISAGERLPPILTDLVRGMLAEDPEHRPSPAVLRETSGSRGRRVAARPAPRAQRALKIGAMTVWNNRTLALAMAAEPDEAVAAILGGTLMFWLRRGLGDSVLAVKLEELVRQHGLDLKASQAVSHSLLVMKAIADADIFMPLCWRDLVLFPGGLGSMLAVAMEIDPDLQRKLHDVVNLEVQGVWAGMREDRAPAAPQRLEARHRRSVPQIRGPAGGLPRLAYTLSPITPCASTLLADRWITSVSDLAPALEAVAIASRDADLLEPRIAAFIGARSERWLDQEVRALATEGDAADRALDVLRLLSELQVRYHPGPMPGLTAWVVARARPLVEQWKNRDRRSAVEEQLKALTTAGFLAPILALLRDQAAHAKDLEGLRIAQLELEIMDAELRGISEGGHHRAAFAARLGQEIAAGVGLAVAALTLILAALG